MLMMVHKPLYRCAKTYEHSSWLPHFNNVFDSIHSFFSHKINNNNNNNIHNNKENVYVGDLPKPTK